MDVFINASKVAIQHLKSEGWVLNHMFSSEDNPKVRIPARGGKEESFSYIKETPEEIIEKLYVAQG